MDSLISQSINCPEEMPQLSPAEDSWAQRYLANPMAGAVRGFGQAAEMPLKVGARALNNDWLSQAVKTVEEATRIDPNADVESIGYKIGQAVGGTAGGFAQLLPVIATGIGSIPAMALLGAASSYGEGGDTLQQLLGAGQGAAMGSLFPFARGIRSLPLRLGTMGGTGALVSGLESGWDPASMGIGAGQMMAMGAKGAPKGSTLGERFKLDLIPGYKGAVRPTPVREEMGITQPTPEQRGALQDDLHDLLALTPKKGVSTLTPAQQASLQRYDLVDLNLGDIIQSAHGDPVIRGGLGEVLVNPNARGLHTNPRASIKASLADALDRVPGADTPEFRAGRETLQKSLGSVPEELLDRLGSLGIPPNLASAEGLVHPFFKGQVFGSPETQGTGGRYNSSTGTLTIESWGGLKTGAEAWTPSPRMAAEMKSQGLNPANPEDMLKYKGSGGAGWGDVGSHEVGHHNYFSRWYDKITPKLAQEFFPDKELAIKWLIQNASGRKNVGSLSRVQTSKDLGGNPFLDAARLEDPQRFATWLYLSDKAGVSAQEAYSDAFAKYHNPELQLTDDFSSRYGLASQMEGERLLQKMHKDGLEPATDAFINQFLKMGIDIGREFPRGGSRPDPTKPMKFPEQGFTKEEIRKSYKEEKGGKTITHGKGSKQGGGGLRADTEAEVKAAKDEAPLTSVRDKMHVKIDPKTGESVKVWDFPGEDQGFEPGWGSMENALNPDQAPILPKNKLELPSKVKPAKIDTHLEQMKKPVEEEVGFTPQESSSVEALKVAMSEPNPAKRAALLQQWALMEGARAWEPDATKRTFSRGVGHGTSNK